jgi:hypothetical protein
MNRTVPETPVGHSDARTRHRRNAVAAVLLGGAFAGSLFAVPDPEPVVVTHPVVERPTRHTGGVRPVWAAAPGSQQAGSAQSATGQPGTSATAQAGEAQVVQCTGPNPGPSWGCHNGVWQLGPPPAAPVTGGGRIDRAAGCLSEQPGPSFVCRNGSWTIATTDAADAAPAPPATRDASGDGAECPPPSPGAGFTCVGGAWQPGTPPATASPPATMPAVVPLPTAGGSAPMNAPDGASRSPANWE